MMGPVLYQIIVGTAGRDRGGVLVLVAEAGVLALLWADQRSTEQSRDGVLSCRRDRAVGVRQCAGVAR